MEYFKVFDRNQLHEVSFFKQSIPLELRNITLQIYTFYIEWF